MVTKMDKNGYGVLELNNVAFRRNGNVEAMCDLSDGFTKETPAENGMLLQVDKIKSLVEIKDRMPSSGFFPYGLLYTSESQYDAAEVGLNKFCSYYGDGNMARVGFLSVGDVFTTNTIAYESTDFVDSNTLQTALKKEIQVTSGSRLYGIPNADNGYIQIVKFANIPATGLLMSAKATTLPDGYNFGVQFEVVRV